MEPRIEPADTWIGRRLKHDVYSDQGMLLLPASSRLDGRGLRLLRKHRVPLRIEDTLPSSAECLVEDAIAELKETFHHVREKDEIHPSFMKSRILTAIGKLSEFRALGESLAALESHDDYTYRHSIGVAVIARMIGQVQGLKEPFLSEIAAAGILHDIGKLAVPGSILNKPSALDVHEFERMKNHTRHGFRIIRKSKGVPEHVALAALQHHEREDGSGYPNGLVSDGIPVTSKIVAVADVFHAMISRRPYKSPVALLTALRVLRDECFGRLDPRSGMPFIRRVMESLVGGRIRLSDGRVAKLVLLMPDPLTPLVECGGAFVDLSRHPDLTLERIVTPPDDSPDFGEGNDFRDPL